MAKVMLMPLLSDTMTEGTVAAWHKNVGDKVQIGELLLEIETDKAVMEQDSFFTGTLLHIGVQPGESVPVNAVLAVIGEAGEDYQVALAEALGKKAPAAPAETTPEPALTPLATPAATADTRTKASPLAKSMAKEAGVDLAKVQGTGDNGRIVKRDIETFLTTPPTQPVVAPQVKVEVPVPVPTPTPVPAPASAALGSESYEEVSVSQMRKTIARRLAESKFGAPHFYLTISINMDAAGAARKRMNEMAGVKISFNDLVIKAAAVALRQHPVINSSWLGDKIRYNHHVNIGVAVAVEEGLIVPVVRHADLKSLSQIGNEVRTLADKAKNRKLSGNDMTGNTFTISNLGMFGIEEFTAIINPPDSCILAVGAIVPTPIVKDGAVAIANMMKVTLSCDHRTVDGASGAKFLQTFQQLLEDPLRMLV